MADKEKTATLQTKARLCELAEQQPVVPLPEIYRNMMAQTPRADEDVMAPAFTSCRTQMHRARRQNMPELPKEIKDIVLEGEWATTLAGTDFILHKDDKMIILTTDSNLKILTQSDTVFMDGTFKSCPRIFSQLYSIHGCYRNHVVPLVYCLLSDKSRLTYHTMFSKIRDRMAELDLIFSPSTIITDFEASIIPVIQHNFPTENHRGCYFHFTQAICRQVQTSGLQPAYDSDDRVHSAVRGLMALAFLPVLAVRPAFHGLEEQEIIQENQLLTSLFDYFEKTWLKSFPLRLWNVHNAATRTNNKVEGWHSRLNRYVKKSHPNIFELITELKKEQATTELTISRARLGAAPPPRKAQYIQLDAQLDRLKTNFDAGDYTVEDYLASLRRLVHHY